MKGETHTSGIVVEKQGLPDPGLSLLNRFLCLLKGLCVDLPLCVARMKMVKVDCRQDRGGRGQKGKCVSPAHLFL